MAIEEFDLPPSPEQLQAIGMVAVEWSYLESVIAAAIGATALVALNLRPASGPRAEPPCPRGLVAPVRLRRERGS